MNRTELIRSVKRASREIAQSDWPMGSQKEREMIAEWRRIRPKMVNRLLAMGILKEFAHLIETRRFEAETANLTAGMGWPDSREQANRDWLIWEAEADEDPQAPEEAEAGVDQMLARAAKVDEMPSMWEKVPRKILRRKSSQT